MFIAFFQQIDTNIFTLICRNTISLWFDQKFKLKPLLDKPENPNHKTLEIIESQY